MKIPNKLDIFSQDITVEYVTDQQHSQTGSYCDYYSNINLHKLNEGLSEALQAETFLHEIIECLNIKMELKLEHNQITSLSTALFHVIRNNNLDFRRGKK
jgi:hypothetical protein